MEFVTPPSYGATRVNVGGIATDGKILCAGVSNTVEHIEVKGDDEANWPEPSAVSFWWKGKSAEGKDVEASLVGPLGARRDRVDIMAEVPKFVKTIVASAAGTRPYIYQVCFARFTLAALGRKFLANLFCTVHSKAEDQDQDWRRRGGRGGHHLHRGDVHLGVRRRSCRWLDDECFTGNEITRPAFWRRGWLWLWESDVAYINDP